MNDRMDTRMGDTMHEHRRHRSKRPAPDGLVFVDKPTGWTSHDVVARIRRMAATRRVGHAGTLDPMATGVLVLGVGRATRLLGYLSLTEKAYDATIRLGQSTVTDDAEGEMVSVRSAAGVSDEDIEAGVAALTGEIEQIPSRVSAVKVGGKRSYARVRAGEDVELAPRTVTILSFEVDGVRRMGGVVDVGVSVVCSSGTYIRALARDLGASLGVGGHLTRLRRTRVGRYGLDIAHTIPELERSFSVLPVADAVAETFPCREVAAGEARFVAHGGRLPAVGLGPGPIGVYDPDGRLLALVEETAGEARPLVVFGG